MKTVIIKYNAGNIRSLYFALKRLGVEAEVTGNPDKIRKADKVIFPGVGEASTTMSYLRERELDKLITGLKQDFLGICLGMQLMCSFSEEGNVPCLGIFPSKVRRFEPASGVKVPHMGWNQLERVKGKLLDPCMEGGYVYFVHSYYVEAGPLTSATAFYGSAFSAAIEQDNFYATQFHPEKSGYIGSKILKNFLEL